MFGPADADIGYVAGVLAVAQAAPYVASIVRGQTKPSRAANAIWSIANCVEMTSYISAGARTTIWFGLATTLTGLIILALSVTRGMGGYSALDLVCLAVSGLAIGLWITTRDPLTALYLGCSTVALGYVPVLKKASLAPSTENFTSWRMCFAAALLNLAALASVDPQVALPPLVSAVGAGATFGLLRGPARGRPPDGRVPLRRRGARFSARFKVPAWL